MFVEMKTFALFVGVILSVVVVNAGDMYTTEYDNIDIDEILNNKRVLGSYVNCLMDKGPCTADGAELKRVLPEALETECEKCSDFQKQRLRKSVLHMVQHEPDYLKSLRMHYDPDGHLKTKYCEKYL